jgi:D-glycerate 3-kinase
LLDRQRLPHSMLETLAAVHVPLAARLASAARTKQPYIVGICGAQGSGKSTLAPLLQALLTQRELTVATLSLDDCYLPQSEREHLARTLHPLLQTRGVPGTHDVALAMRTLDALGRDGTVAMPAFDKARDDRTPEGQWTRVQAPIDVVLFEGWCVGAAPQDENALGVAINALERECDPQQQWRRYVNRCLRDDYQRLFAATDLLVLLQAPAFEVVHQWRAEQEHKLRARIEREGGDGSGLMNDEELGRFIAHYERLTRHILDEMPTRADIVIELDASRRVVRCRGI